MSDIRLGMLIDLSRCVGCNACAVACKQENGVPLGKFNTWIESWDVVDGSGRVRRANLPRLCNHCTDAPCVDVCPTGASFHAEDGTVQIDPDKCIGCKYCMAACPYSMRWCDDETGIVGKCTFCHTRTANGMDPACVNTCISSARIFGDLNDPDSEIAKRVAAGGDEVLLAELNLRPHVSYRGLEETQAMEVASAKHKGGNVYEPYEGR